MCEPVPADYDDAQALPAAKMAAQVGGRAKAGGAQRLLLLPLLGWAGWLGWMAGLGWAGWRRLVAWAHGAAVPRRGGPAGLGSCTSCGGSASPACRGEPGDPHHSITTTAATAATAITAAAAPQALDLLALNISSQHVFPIVAAFVRATADSSEPSQRAAAMNGLAVTSEGCSEALRKRLKEVLPLVLRGLQDPDKGARLPGCVRGGWGLGLGGGGYVDGLA
jgi:hypothetical protein